MGAPIPLRANIFPMLENHQNSKLFSTFQMKLFILRSREEEYLFFKAFIQKMK